MRVASATITGRGTAHLVAKDDFARLRLDTKAAAPLTLAVFRTAPLQFCEAVYGRWLPLRGRTRRPGFPSIARAGEGGTTPS